MKNIIKPALLPINKFAFEEIRTRNMIYVDKTQLIYNMISMPDYYFLSRPRRFGKSLLVSILKHYYLGHRQYFKGLWIDQHSDCQWKEWPVLIIDFNSISSGNKEELKQGFHDVLENNMDRYNIKLSQKGLKEKFKEALTKLNKATNSKVVILVDEYDKPIIDHLAGEDQTKIAKANRSVMKEFFGVLKDNEAGPLVELLFITGVSKFSQVSIFSDLNTMTDISMDEEYSTLLGYTQEELDFYFANWLEQWHVEKNINISTIKNRLKERYDGFRFSKKDVKVYNPISILFSLQQKNYNKNYWFKTATPTFLIDLLVEKNINIPDIENARLVDTDFDSFDPDNINSIALMFQTGYLTIKDVIKQEISPDLYVFDYPNVEVKESFLKLLMVRFSKIETYNSEPFYIFSDLANKRFELIIDNMQTLFKLIPKLDMHDGKFFHQFFYMMIKTTCPISRALDKTDKMLMYVESDEKKFILNFSCQYSTQELLSQIKNSNFFKSYPDIYKIGIHFDLPQRKILDWTFELPNPEPVPIPKEMENSIKKIKIFLSSSVELMMERQEIALFIQRENNKLIQKGFYYELIIWEDLLHSFTKDKIQNYFNEKMLECDVVIVLFGSKLGKFTNEEFQFAWKHLKKGNNPKYMFVFFKEVTISSQDRKAFKNYSKILDIIDLIEKNEQLYESFKDSYQLIGFLKKQFDLIKEVN